MKSKSFFQENSRRGNLIRFFVWVLIFFALISIYISTQIYVDGKTPRREKMFLFIPKTEVVKHFSLGFDSFLADIYWLRCVQYAAEKEYTPNGIEWMYNSLDLITSLDPEFETAYLFGGIILTSEPKYVHLSNEILEKGYESLPGRWRLPFYLGFNYFFYLNKFDKAAEYLFEAGKMPGAPKYLIFLASRLLTEAKEPETALSFLYRMYEQEKDPVTRIKIKERIALVTVERDIDYLTRAIERFEKKFKRKPGTIGEIVSMGIIEKIPVEPGGGYYYIDGERGEVRSSKVDRRLRLYRKK